MTTANDILRIAYDLGLERHVIRSKLHQPFGVVRAPGIGIQVVFEDK